MSFNLTDDLDCKINLQRAPGRIVSLVPSLTETLVHLGALDKLIGVTKYCIYPAGALSKVVRVGGTKNPSIEKILSLNPDIVIANAEENEKDHVQQLKKHVKVFVTFPRTVDGALKTVLDLGEITGSLDKAKDFIHDCKHFLTSKIGLRENHSKKPSGKGDSNPASSADDFAAACLVWRKPWMAAGAHTYISDLLKTFGFSNVIPAGEGRYPVITLEKLVHLKPQIVLLPDEPYDFQEKHREELEEFFDENHLSPKRSSCNEEEHASAWEGTKILLVDGTMLSWFGWRSRRAFDYLIRLKQSLL